MDAVITDAHLLKIAKDHSDAWRLLSFHMKNLPSSIVSVIENQCTGEDEKKIEFLKEWRERNGSEATYGNLISALDAVKRKCAEDIQSVTTLADSLPSPITSNEPARLGSTEEPIVISDDEGGVNMNNDADIDNHDGNMDNDVDNDDAVILLNVTPGRQTNPQESSQASHKSDINIAQSMPSSYSSNPNSDLTQKMDSSNPLSKNPNATSSEQDMNSVVSLPSLTSRTNYAEDIDSNPTQKADSSNVMSNNPNSVSSGQDMNSVVSLLSLTSKTNYTKNIIDSSDTTSHDSASSLSLQTLNANSTQGAISLNSPKLTSDMSAERSSTKPSVLSFTSLPSSSAKAQKIAGQRRKRSKSRSPIPFGITLALAGGQPEQKKRKTSNEKQNPKRLSRCSRQDAHLCEVCSQPDCGECSNCLNKKKRHASCKLKPRSECPTWKKKKEEQCSSGVIIGSESEDESAVQSDDSVHEIDSMEVSSAFPGGSTSSDNEMCVIQHDHENGSQVFIGTEAGSLNSSTQPRQEAVMSMRTETDVASEHANGVVMPESQSSVPSTSSEEFSASIAAMPSVAPTMQFNPIFQEEISASSGSDHQQQSNTWEQASSSSLTSLHDPSGAQTTQGNGDKDDQETDATLEKGLNDGLVELHITKCGVSGPPETGKSHVRALMLGLPRPKERRSTAVATEADQVTPDYSRVHSAEDFVDMTKGYMWKVIKEDSMARFIANTLHNEDYKKDEACESTEEKLSTRRDLRKRCRLILDVKKHLSRMRGKRKQKRKGLNTLRIVYFVDTGGQPQFQEILPNFIKCDINLLVHNLSQPLEHCPEFNYVINKKNYSVPDSLRQSNGEIIEQSVRSITSSISASECKQFVAVVGTFKDKCNPNSEEYKKMLKEKSKTIYERLHPYIGDGVDKCGMFSPQRGENHGIFAIDASEQGWDGNFDSLESLKSRILSCADNRPVKVPIRYFLFLQSILSFAKKPHDKKYVTLDECYKVASENDIAMTKSDVTKALEIFDDCNLILYFSSSLPNIAFIKPGFLFGMVTDLIVASFQCESDMTSEERIFFQKTGIFSLRILNDIPSLKLTDKNFTQQNFLALLKRLFIIAEFDHGKYFMPCVLPLETDAISEELKKTQDFMNSNGIDGPLMISFPQRMSPRGLFCALVVALVEDFSWKLSKSSQRIYRRRNLVEFGLSQNRTNQVTVVDRKSHFEIYTTCEPSFCSNIKQTICEAFKTACENMNYIDEKVIGLPCRCKNEVHSTAVQHVENGPWKERCSINQRARPIPLTPKRLVWFSDVSSQSDPSEFLRQLCTDVAQNTNKWQFIALYLKISPVMIERIDTECRGIIQDCFVRVFEQWRRQCDPPYTWSTIIDALKHQTVDEEALAEELRQTYAIVI